MKIKILITSLGAFLTLISGIGFNLLNNQIDVKQKENIIANVIESEDIDNLTEEIVLDLANRQEENIEKQEQNNEETTEIIENTEVKENVVSITQNEIPKKAENNVQNKETSLVKQNTEVKQEIKQQEKKQGQPKEDTKVENVEEKKAEEKAQKELTPSDLGYWCAEGGTHHVAGDDANEHGYYSSWEEAHNAFESYTSGWQSVQYKISQCACGKFYFWAIQ